MGTLEKIEEIDLKFYTTPSGRPVGLSVLYMFLKMFTGRYEVYKKLMLRNNQ